MTLHAPTLLLAAGLLLMPAGSAAAEPAPLPPPAAAPQAAAHAALAAGRHREAEGAFLSLAAQSGPAEAGPLLGAAVAAGAAGDPERAAQRIRLVLLREPAALRRWAADADLAEPLRAARSTVEAGLLDSTDPSRSLLAAAAIDYLLGELETARLSLAAAVRRDGLQPPMRALDRLIQEARLAAPAEAAPQEPPAEPAAASQPVPAAAPPVAAAPARPASTPPRLLRPVPAGERPRRPGVFLDYERLNLRVSEMAGSLESFENKLLRSLMRPTQEGESLP